MFVLENKTEALKKNIVYCSVTNQNLSLGRNWKTAIVLLLATFRLSHTFTSDWSKAGGVKMESSQSTHM